MKNVLTATALIAALIVPTTSLAAPYCEAMSVKDQLPSKYQKRGPFYSDAKAGWIIGDDQLRAKFDVTEEAIGLWSAINAEFDARGVKLAVMAAPPRPLFAPADALNSTGVAGRYDTSAAELAFASYIAGLNAVGITAPDLLNAAKVAERPFYFRRDTHWTLYGAALSAQALAADMGLLADDAIAPEFKSTYDEKGSLSTVAEAACGKRPDAETVAAPDYAKAGDALSLLGDAPTDGPAIALVGTSFSNRYQRDAYQVADAVAHFTGASVENVSISGGGVTAAMEAFIRGGALASGRFDTVVWEAPYTEPLTNISALRQILGALISQRGSRGGDAQSIQLSDKWISVTPELDLAAGGALDVEIAGVQTGQLDIELYDQDSKKVRVKLRKSDRIEPSLRSDVWSVALDQLDIKAVTRIKLRLKGAKSKTSATLSVIKL